VNSLYAHSLGNSIIYLQIYDDKVTGRFEITIRDINNILNLKDSEDPVTQDNFKERINDLQDYYLMKVRFMDGSDNMPIRFTGLDLMKLGFANFVLIDFVIIKNAAVPDVIDIDYSVMFDEDPDHLGYLVIEQHWRANIFNNESQILLTFSPEERRQQLDVANYSLFNGFKGIVKLGIKHIWKGIDHILFLVALILPAAMLRHNNNWQPVAEFRPAFMYVVKIVTLFTIAHSITLSLAALSIVKLPSRIVESVIALSIAVAAMDILFPIFHRQIGWVVFIFGLFHGFGFASVLKNLGVLGEHMALSLFGFNLGVEIGQVVIICLAFPILYFVRQFAYFPKIIMRYGAVALILMAAVWFVERAFLETPFAQMLNVLSFQLKGAT
jgi:hypothetical protein